MTVTAISNAKNEHGRVLTVFGLSEIRAVITVPKYRELTNNNISFNSYDSFSNQVSVKTYLIEQSRLYPQKSYVNPAKIQNTF